MSVVRPISVLHVASHRINVGDGALVSVIQRSLRGIAGQAGDAIHFEDFDIVDLEPVFGGVDFSASVNLTDHDLVLVGGGGTIDNKRTRTSSGMAFPLSGDDVRRSPTPLAYVAVGYNLFAGTRLRNAEALADVLRACAERGFPFSVRNDGSLERLREAVGSAADAVTEVPDPGFFVAVDEGHVSPQFSGHRPRVILQVAGDNPGFRFATPAAGMAGIELVGRVRNKLKFGLGRSLAAELAELVKWLVEQLDVEVVLAPHISTDLPLITAILQRIPTRIERKRVRVLGVPDPAGASRFFAAYAAADLVIGMRGHSVICAVGLRVPCLALSSHPKVAGFMEACGLSDWVVQYGSHIGSALRSRAERLLTDPGDHLRRRDQSTIDFRRRLNAFLARCWHLVR